jgi:hypothetical protein
MSGEKKLYNSRKLDLDVARRELSPRTRTEIRLVRDTARPCAASSNSFMLLHLYTTFAITQRRRHPHLHLRYQPFRRYSSPSACA